MARPPVGADVVPAVCCDLDGVVWRGDEVIPGAPEAIAAMRNAGLRVAFCSNNSRPTRAEYLAKLGAMGIDTAAEDVLSSADAAASLLAGNLAAGARVLVGGGDGVAEALTNAAFTPVTLEDRSATDVEAVVVGWHEFDFRGLSTLAAAVRGGARFVATNVDATYPTPDGLLPGSGSIVAAVATASGHEPVVAGKPEAPMAALVRERLGARGVVVGDRTSTDGALADAIGWPFALVLSGVTTVGGGPGREAVPAPSPPYVAEDLAALASRLIADLG